jgi:hypothetical protein
MANLTASGPGCQPLERWRSDDLPRLKPLNLPLLAVGASRPDEDPPKRKAPADPRTGRLLSGWTTAQHTVEAIQSAHPDVIAAGTRTGADAGGLLVVDVDGETALSWLLERGCDPEQTTTWQIHRNTDAARLKVAFRLSGEQQQQLGQLKRKVHTKDAVKGADGEVLQKGEAVEVFHGSGQVIVLGQHWESGGFYYWPDQMGPEALAPIPECWWAAMLEVVGASTPAAKSSTARGVWRSLPDCPICGRNTTSYCAIHQDGKTIRCFHGSTFSPPTGLRPGEEHTDRNGQIWAFSRKQQQSNGDVFSVFVTPDPASRFGRQQSHDTRNGTERKNDNSTAYSRPIRLETHAVMERLEAGEIGQLRLNVRSGDVQASAQVLSGNDIARLYLRLSSASEKWPKETTADAVVEIAGQNRFDPVADYLNSNTSAPLPMEQWQRLDRHLLGIDDPIAAAFLPRYLVSAVARVFEPGASVRQVPVLVGPQWRGKSALGRILFGAGHWVEGIGELGKDDLMKAHTAWGVELAELDGVTRRSDQEKLKAFLTERTDTYRKPYDRSPERHDRRFVFWGTSNAAPLRDTTGSTRFVTIPIPDRMLPLEWAEQNRDAIWARAVEQYRAGVQWDRCEQDERDLIAARNEDFTELDPWTEPVRLHLNRRKAEGMVPAQIPEILEAIGVPTERQGNREAKRVRQIAEALGWSYGRKRINGKQERGIWPPVPTAVPTVPTAVPTAVPTGPASDCKGSAPLCQPRQPKLKELKKQENDHSTPPPSATEKRNFPERVARVARVAQASDCKGSAVGTPCPVVGTVGTPPSWWPVVEALLKWEPDLDPIQGIPNRLMADHGLNITGRQVKEAMKQFWEVA